MIVMYTDGGCRGNPGESSIGVSFRKNNLEINRISERIGIATCNEAEYLAIYQGLKKAIELGYLDLEVKADSQLAIMCIGHHWKTKTEHLKPIVKAAKELLPKFKTITFKHIPRELNSRADFLANLALDTKQVVGKLDVQFQQTLNKQACLF